jgi:hypothetical protein
MTTLEQDDGTHLTYEFDTHPDYNTPRLRAVFVERMLVMGYEKLLRPLPRNPAVDDGRHHIDSRLLVLRTVRTKQGMEQRWCHARLSQERKTGATRWALDDHFVAHITALGWHLRGRAGGHGNDQKRFWTKPGTPPDEAINEKLYAQWDKELFDG